MKYRNDYEDVTQAEIDALSRDDLLAIAIDWGSRRLVRCTAVGERPADGPGHIAAVDDDALIPVAYTGELHGPDGEVIQANEIWIDPEIPRQAGWDDEEIAEWTEWATGVLDLGCATGEWPEGKPVLADRGPVRGPRGERYVLLGFGG